MTASASSYWERRIERAAELEKKVPAAAEILRFYRAIARWQAKAESSEALRQSIERDGPAALAEAARHRAEPAETFISRVVRQAQAVRDAAHSDISLSATPSTCPFCGEPPLAAVLRPEGEGGKRHLLCSLCLSEWPFRRMLCPRCGEENYEKLPVYTAEEFPHIRIEACDCCRHYLKAVDLTVDGRSVPEVDELASLALDLWAAEKHYVKIAANLFEL
jgi:FdhE protein